MRPIRVAGGDHAKRFYAILIVGGNGPGGFLQHGIERGLVKPHAPPHHPQGRTSLRPCTCPE